MGVAQEQQPQLGIVNRTQCSGFWRYDFNYTTTDIDEETPIVLSAAIFLSTEIHNKTKEAKGLALMNHYTITSNYERPTNVSGPFTLEGFIQGSDYIIIESDGIGFGLTVDRKQPYLKGRATARTNIDALLAGQTLLEEEGIGFGEVVVNLGYSQGGHSGMWVNRLVAEGYRSDELPKINYCLIGGGPYDMYAHYQKLATDGTSYYPVAISLILNGIIDDFTTETISHDDVFKLEFTERIPEWFDSKKYKSTAINSMIYENFGGSEESGLPINAIVTDAFFHPEGTDMEKACQWLKNNSLVYDEWSPEHTDAIKFIHSQNDEVVPYVNMENMAQFLRDNGYNAFTIDDNQYQPHRHRTVLCSAGCNGISVIRPRWGGYRSCHRLRLHWQTYRRLLYRRLPIDATSIALRCLPTTGTRHLHHRQQKSCEAITGGERVGLSSRRFFLNC